ncbi:MAG: class I SAM-dependent methyltransferase [Cyclobacteriaceae bacterium]|nr:class I SAM-dependent methyltransferase [Cyclobacteriaceae bacterium]
MLRKNFKKYLKSIRSEEFLVTQEKIKLENEKLPYRWEIINYLLSFLDRETTYLEIGVRNPDDCFNKIKASTKFSVDPGLETDNNLASFKVTSDEFFKGLISGDFLKKDIKFDVIFIDGLHLADQAERDIAHSFEFLKKDGFIVIHDCNPPTFWTAREKFDYHFTPAEQNWNGTTWKAFLKWRMNNSVQSCCIDTDWGVGILSKHYTFGSKLEDVNPFYEYHVFDNNRKEHLNLVDFEEFKTRLVSENS